MKFNEKGIFSICMLLLIVDQLVKHNISNSVLNFGAGFGVLQNQRWLLVVIAILIIVALSYLYYKEKSLAIKTSYSLIIFGTLSNIVDRVFLGYVIDYLPFPFWPAFPTFNIGDSMICVGVGLLALYEFLIKNHIKRKSVEKKE
jgi:signal peptidase II